jgi:hypothetical protein
MAIAFLFGAAACSSTLFKVKPSAALRTMPADAATANVGVATLRAAPLLTDEETQELFESNLQLAGVLPIRVGVLHNGGLPMELRKLKFTLRDDVNNEWKFISGKQAVSRILKANGIFLYNPNARKTFEKEVRAYEFDVKQPLTREERQRQGMIFFLSAQKQPVASPRGLVLSIEGLPQPVSLKLN